MCDGGRAPLKKIIRPFKNMLVSLDHKTCFWFFFLPAIMVLSSFAVTIWQRKFWILLDKIDSLFQLEWIFFLGTLKINANALSLIFFINANTLIIMYHVSDNFGKNRKTFFVLPVKDFYVIVFDNLHWLFWKSIIYPHLWRAHLVHEYNISAKIGFRRINNAIYNLHLNYTWWIVTVGPWLPWLLQTKIF